jgi:hypothetical protein
LTSKLSPLEERLSLLKAHPEDPGTLELISYAKNRPKCGPLRKGLDRFSGFDYFADTSVVFPLRRDPH